MSSQTTVRKCRCHSCGGSAESIPQVSCSECGKQFVPTNETTTTTVTVEDGIRAWRRVYKCPSCLERKRKLNARYSFPLRGIRKSQ